MRLFEQHDRINTKRNLVAFISFISAIVYAKQDTSVFLKQNTTENIDENYEYCLRGDSSYCPDIFDLEGRSSAYELILKTPPSSELRRGDLYLYSYDANFTRGPDYNSRLLYAINTLEGHEVRDATDTLFYEVRGDIIDALYILNSGKSYDDLMAMKSRNEILSLDTQELLSDDVVPAVTRQLDQKLGSSNIDDKNRALLPAVFISSFVLMCIALYVKKLVNKVEPQSQIDPENVTEMTSLRKSEAPAVTYHSMA